MPSRRDIARPLIETPPVHIRGECLAALPRAPVARAVRRRAGCRIPYAENAGVLAAAARAAGVEVVLINAPVTQEHNLGTACHPDLRRLFSSQLDRAVEYAQELGVRHLNVLAGRRGDRPHAECEATLADNLLLAAERVARVGARVLLEPLNPLDMPGYFVGNLGVACSIIDTCAARVGLLFDVYHVARMGEDPLTALTRVQPRMRHVQFADAPGRHEPGTGSVRFEPLWERLCESGYNGHVAAEYFAVADTASGLAWLDRWRSTMARR